MLIDTHKVSPWYVLHRGFRLTKDCRNCGEENSHYKAYDKFSSGILSRCESCHKEIVRMKLRIHDKSPFNGDPAIDNKIFRGIRERAGGIERFDGGVVEFLHS